MASHFYVSARREPACAPSDAQRPVVYSDGVHAQPPGVDYLSQSPHGFGQTSSPQAPWQMYSQQTGTHSAYAMAAPPVPAAVVNPYGQVPIASTGDVGWHPTRQSPVPGTLGPSALCDQELVNRFNREDPQGMTELMRLVREGDVHKLYKWLENLGPYNPPLLAQIVNYRSSQGGFNALYFAAERKDAAMVDYLLRLGADFKKSALTDGFTPTHLAAQNGDIETLKVLLDAGESVDRVIDSPNNMNGIPHGATPLFRLATFDYTKERCEAASFLLARGANVNLGAAGLVNMTPLYAAIDHDNRKLAEILLAAGAKVDQATTDGYTPLHVAADKGHKHAAELLLEYSPRIDAKTAGGKTPLDLAVENRHSSIVELLHSRMRTARDLIEFLT